MPTIFADAALLAASLAFVTVLGTAAWAQQPPTVRIRGTIEAVDGADAGDQVARGHRHEGRA